MALISIDDSQVLTLTTIGKSLAKRFNWKFVDTCQDIRYGIWDIMFEDENKKPVYMTVDGLLFTSPECDTEHGHEWESVDICMELGGSDLVWAHLAEDSDLGKKNDLVAVVNC